MAKETVESLFHKAQQAVSRGENDTARRYYQQALALKADAADVHYGMATVCFLLQDLNGAVYHFKEVIRLDPRRAGAHINLGAVYNRQDKLDEAIAELRRGIQLDHNRAEGFYNLGIVYRRKGQFDLAIQAYREAVRLNPRMSDAHYNIGNIYFEREQFGLALAHYKQALEARPKWEKAAHGVEQSEALLNPTKDEPTEPDVPAVKEEAFSVREPESTPTKIDPKRPLVPEVHGILLTSLHKATLDADTASRTFLKFVESEMEPALKELSSCLLQHHGGPMDVERCLQKFELALIGMRTNQEQMQSSMQRVQKVGQQLLGS